MRDHLIENRPALLRDQDQWMLDRWSAPEQHVVRLHHREFTVPHSTGVKRQRREYRYICSCGWRSRVEGGESPGAMPRSSNIILIGAEDCPVAEALARRMVNLQKATERIEWVPVTD